MIKSKLELENYARDCSGYTFIDTFELIPEDSTGYDFVFSCPGYTHLNNNQVQQLIDYLEMMLKQSTKQV